MTHVHLLTLVFVAPPVFAQDGSLGDAYSQISALVRRHDASGTGPVQAASAGSAAQASPAPRGPERWDVDLSGQLPDNGGNQGSIGDCHDFSATNLIEAALDRRTGQHTVLGPLFFKDFDLSTDKPREGDFENYDAAYGLDHGIATNLDYDQFQRLYTD